MNSVSLDKPCLVLLSAGSHQALLCQYAMREPASGEIGTGKRLSQPIKFRRPTANGERHTCEETRENTMPLPNVHISAAQARSHCPLPSSSSSSSFPEGCMHRDVCERPAPRSSFSRTCAVMAGEQEQTLSSPLAGGEGIACAPPGGADVSDGRPARHSGWNPDNRVGVWHVVLQQHTFVNTPAEAQST